MIAAVVLAAAAAFASPSPSPTPSAWVEAGGSLAGLTNDRGSWRTTYLAAGTKQGRRAYDVALSTTERFQAADRQVSAGAYWPASSQTIAHVAIAWSPTARILPRSLVAASLEHRLAGGWGYIAGAETRAYSGLGVETQSVIVDRYWGGFRAAYRLSTAELSDVPGIAVDHALSFTHYYDPEQGSAVTVTAAFGREVENVGSLLVSPTFELAVGGTHRFAVGALIWSLSSLRQGSLYRKTQVDVGLRRTF